MNNNTLSLHEIVKNSYSKKKNPQMGGYEYDAQLSNHNQQVYYNPKQKKLLYSIAGTHNLSDVGTDFYLATGHLKDTNRYKEAKSTLDKAKSKYHVGNATIAGHSLGGSIAGYVGSKDDKVFTLDKGATIGQKVKKGENAFRSSGDAVSALNANSKHMKTIHSNHSLFGTVAKAFVNPLGAVHDILSSHDADNIKSKPIYV